MQIGKAGDARDPFVETRVVFHRARAQRVHAEVDRIVPGGHANEVTDHVNLADLGHTFEIVVTTEFRGELECDFIDIEGRQTISNAPGL